MKYCDNCGRELVDGRCSWCGNINSNLNNQTPDEKSALKMGNTSLVLIVIPYIVGFIYGIGLMFLGLIVSDLYKTETNFFNNIGIILHFTTFVPIILFPFLILSIIFAIISLSKHYNKSALLALILSILPIIIYSIVFLT